MADVKPIPEGYHSLTPYLVIDGAAEAMEYYKKAFGAVELFRMEHRRKDWPRRNEDRRFAVHAGRCVGAVQGSKRIWWHTGKPDDLR